MGVLPASAGHREVDDSVVLENATTLAQQTQALEAEQVSVEGGLGRPTSARWEHWEPVVEPVALVEGRLGSCHLHSADFRRLPGLTPAAGPSRWLHAIPTQHLAKS